jgi:signal peptide peptidase SppA
MKYTRLLDLAFNSPLIITEGAFWSIHKLIEAFVLSQPADHNRGPVRVCGEDVDIPGMTFDPETGIAQIPIAGAIGMGLEGYEKLSGACDVADIGAEIAEANRRPEVSTILFVVDSPGGMVNGTPELADVIKASAKPTYTFSHGGSIASGAYWLAAATDGIFTTKSADVGSIGVLMGYLDRSKMLEDMGLKVQVIKAGKYKGMGFPGTSLTKDQLELLQGRVDSIYAEFTSHVRENRGDVAEETMQGQMFRAPEALKAGLIDQIVADKDEVIRLLCK